MIIQYRHLADKNVANLNLSNWNLVAESADSNLLSSCPWHTIATGVLAALWATAIINVMVLSFPGDSDDPILMLLSVPF
jgi:hypothetical protein